MNFRFMNLDIWKDAIALNDEFFDLADQIEATKSFRFAEQIRGASLSISNNIAEGSGSFSDKDFANFLNIARRSTFETANLSCVAYNRKYISQDDFTAKINKLDSLSRRITNFRKKLINDE